MSDDDDRSYRQLLETCETQASSDFDKTAVTLSGGALGLSLVYLKDIAPAPLVWTVNWLLQPAWLCLVASLLAVLSSQLSSMKSMRYEIERLDRRRNTKDDEPAGGIARFVTSRLNHVSVFKTYGPRREDFFKTFPPLS